VVIGGLMTSMFLKLVVLPAIYRWFDPGPPPPPEPEEALEGADPEPGAVH
jgi:cobalt-zinc-cadmium resistance protein CzcA